MTVERATELAVSYLDSLDAINASGEAFFTGTTWRGGRCTRVSVSSWRTTADDVGHAVGTGTPGGRRTTGLSSKGNVRLCET